MDLRSRHKVDTAFNMSSLADIIFLLLIFFIITSSFVTDTGIKVDNPPSKASELISENITVTIKEDLRYYIERGDEASKEFKKEEIEDALKKYIIADETVVKLNIDKAVATEHTVWILGIAKSLKAKGISIATKETE